MLIYLRTRKNLLLWFYWERSFARAAILMEEVEGLCVLVELLGYGRTPLFWAHFTHRQWNFKISGVFVHLKNDIDRTDMNFSYLDLILHSWKWVAKHLLTSAEIKPEAVENTYWSIFYPAGCLILFLLNKNVKKTFISIMPSAWKNE